MSRYETDVPVVGTGPAGLAVTAMPAGRGVRVVAVDRHPTQGPGGSLPT